MYGDGMKRGQSAGELADAFVAELGTGRLNPALEQAVNKMLGVRKVGELAESLEVSPIMSPPATARAENIESLQDAVAMLQEIIDGKR